jgi:hypothetical protein
MTLPKKIIKTQEQIDLEAQLELLDAEVAEVSGFLEQIKRERTDTLAKLQALKNPIAPMMVGS